ncbi:hypothetical protein [Dictyobacter kobayashii]|uniref:Uncharacterized protein n=1 Tax=Dictyobacter kobayashii TaxID=2014872 RepID=A0A402ASZ5_9CHLR|nr:hypothetical protein [Dictyobacter kobayashii]GCE22205.1 hypothetical protein KDK_60050 [Dictyobacter kobayashii]
MGTSDVVPSKDLFSAPEEENPLLPENIPGVYDLTDGELGVIGGASAVYDLSIGDLPSFRSSEAFFNAFRK